MSEAKYTICGTVLVRPGGQHVGNAATESDAIGLQIELDGLTAQRDAAVALPRCTAAERSLLDDLYRQSSALREHGIGEFSGEYTHWNVIIDVCKDDPACSNGYAECPTELIRAIINDRDEIRAQRDAAVEACRDAITWFDGVFGGGPTRDKLAAVLSATPTPAPSVNAELLAACRELLRVAESDPDTTGFVVRDESGKMTGTRMLSDIVRDAKAVIASAEKAGGPAPTMNAELLAACKKFVCGGDCYCFELTNDTRPCGVCAAKAAIAKAEKSN